MKILEVRDGFIKLEADLNLSLASFLLVNGQEKDYVAQVIQINPGIERAIAYAKILFVLENDELTEYDKTLPSDDSEIQLMDHKILQRYIKVESPIIIGKELGSDEFIKIDSTAFNNRMLISVDDKNCNNLITHNLVKQFNNLNKNVIIIDTLGVIKAKKYVAGVDFKIPLDTNSLNFMYEDCLNDATLDSKSTIIEIFKDLSEYSKTVPFVPFSTLKTIVDDMVDKSHIFKLLVLKNKLSKFNRLGYFASTQNEVEKLSEILNSKCSIIDISKLDPIFQNRYLNFVYEKLENALDTQVLLEVSNVVSKKTIKNVLTGGGVNTTFITHSQFKYLNDIKSIFDNYIVFPSAVNNSVFNVYAPFLKSMQGNTYLVVGECTNYIPLVSKVQDIDELPSVNNDDSELEDIAVETNVVSSEYDTQTSEIISNIDEKSEQVIEKVAEDLKTPDTTEMFSDDTSEDIEELNIVSDEEDTISEPYETVSHKNIVINEEELLAETEEYKEPDSTEEAENPAEETQVTEDESEQNIEEIDENSLGDDVIDSYGETQTEQDELIQPENVEDEVKSEEELEELIQENAENEEEKPEEELSIELSDDIDLDLTVPEDVPDENLEENKPDTKENEIEYSDNNFPEVGYDEVVLPISNDNDELNEIVELDSDDIGDDDIIVDMGDTGEYDNIDEETEEQIIKDVDSVYTTRKEDDFSDADLDLIDELNSDSDGLEEIRDDDTVLEELTNEPSDGNGTIEEIKEGPVYEEINIDSEILEKRDASTPIVPVYDADIPQEDIVTSDPLEQGDVVYHAKHGSGVVEKMIKYGNKILYAINFDNIGRRLLDPTLTEIKKVQK